MSLFQQLAMLLLIVLAISAISCGERHFRLTEEQVEDRIKKELPVGATQQQVKQFIASFKSEFEVDEREYDTHIPDASYADAPKLADSSYRGLIRARIQRVGRDPKIFAIYNLHMVFFFDEKGLLAGHKVYLFGTH